MSVTPPVSPAVRPAAAPGLKGLLAILFWCACGITAAQLAWPFTLIATIGPAAAFSAFVDALSGNSIQTQLLRYGVATQVALFVWAVSFVVLTVLRRRVALTLAPALMLVWLAVSLYCQFGIRAALSPEGMGVDALPALLPTMLAQAAGAVAFVAYLREAPLPRAFFAR